MALTEQDGDLDQLFAFTSEPAAVKTPAFISREPSDRHAVVAQSRDIRANPEVRLSRGEGVTVARPLLCSG
jgi:hypothetical protein